MYITRICQFCASGFAKKVTSCVSCGPKTPVLTQMLVVMAARSHLEKEPALKKGSQRTCKLRLLNHVASLIK